MEKSNLVKHLCWFDLYHICHLFFSKHTKLITRDKVYNMLGKLPQMVFGNLKKKNLSRMQRRRFDDLDVDKNRSLNTRGKRVILDQPNARASLASVALSLLSFQ